jgi:hypothetical protein
MRLQLATLCTANPAQQTRSTPVAIPIYTAADLCLSSCFTIYSAEAMIQITVLERTSEPATSGRLAVPSATSRAASSGGGPSSHTLTAWDMWPQLARDSTAPPPVATTQSRNGASSCIDGR